MKKIINYRLIPVLFAASIATASWSQDVVKNSTGQSQAYYSSNVNDPGTPSATTDVNKKALKDFTRSYRNVENAKWYKTENGDVVSFREKSVTTNIFYSRTGAVDCMIKYYFEDMLSPEISSLVRFNFCNYNISHVTEVHKNGAVAYVVKIEDKSNIKSVRVQDGELEIIEDLVKR